MYNPPRYNHRIPHAIRGSWQGLPMGREYAPPVRQLRDRWLQQSTYIMSYREFRLARPNPPNCLAHPNPGRRAYGLHRQPNAIPHARAHPRRHSYDCHHVHSLAHEYALAHGYPYAETNAPAFAGSRLPGGRLPNGL